MDRFYTAPVDSISKADFLPLLQLAITEDLSGGDITTDSVIPENKITNARLTAREAGVLCGTGVIEPLFQALSAEISLEMHVRDGEHFPAGKTIFKLESKTRAILKAERILLNFIQYLSGIATQTNEVVSKFEGQGLMILDTRKTLPGYRKLAKYAVYCGGGANHRFNLSDMAMLKDNHLAAAGTITEAVSAIRSGHPRKKIELEIDSLSQLDEALQSGVDIILLDNFSIPDTKSAVKIIKSFSAGIRIECSGGITPEKLTALAEIGDIGVSMGYLTHTTRFLDLSLEF